MNPIRSVIIGTGSYLPDQVVENKAFLQHHFYEKDGQPILKDNAEIISKFQDITEIEERRYANKDQMASDLGYLAAKKAIESSGIDPETLDYIICAHNFGDVAYGDTHVQIMPSLASKIKHHLGIENPNCVAYDLPFGCPGWVQGMIQADYYLRSGDAKRVMVIGAETLSRVNDPHDRDSMIFADGAGATIVEGQNTSDQGIIAHKTQTHAVKEAYYLYCGHSSKPDYQKNEVFIKMEGRKIYEYALTNVPAVIKEAIDRAGLDISDIKKILVHQANGKMDEAIAKRLFKLYGRTDMPEGTIPMTIAKLGNSSVATVPTMLDLILKNNMETHELNEGDTVVFASVGAGMNINAIVYKF
ncbi:MAG: 3-oxoacyl-ACP synthase III family protein [Sphingobacteriaceae bacterium]